MTENDKVLLLSALSEVRASLHESFLAGQPSTFCPRGIQTDFEIKVISDDDDDNAKHHGCCEFSIVGGAGWTSKGPAVQRANEFKVTSVSVQLTSTDGAPLPLELVTSTFLHELAHSVTPPERWRPEAIPPELKESDDGGKSWIILHHSPTFYANFAQVLSRAEELGIYSLPSGTKNKYSIRSLKRFDRVSPDMSLSRFGIGKCNLPALKGNGQCHRQRLNIVVTDGQQSKKKTVTLDLMTGNSDDALASVLRAAKTKLNLKKKPSRVKTVLGEDVIDSQMLTSLPDESVLIVM